MGKNEIFDVLKNNILDVLEDEVEEEDIVITKTMKELGASSLDVVQIISDTMRQLKIKIPREELSEIKDIEELVEKILEYKTDK
jgi:polyketide biosynthesis acyl carrier protein